MTSGPQDPQQGGYGQQPPPGQPQYGPPGQPPYGQPQYGQPQYGQPPYGQPPYGQPEYGQGGQGQPGYNPYPSAPQGQEWGGPSAPTERPTTVKAGIGAFLANTVIGLITLLIAFSDMNGYRADLAASSGLSESDLSAIVSTTIAVTVLIMVAFVVVLWFAWNGHNWARIVLWVLGGINVLFGLLGAAGLTFLGVIGLLLIIAGIVLLALKPSNDWYRAESRRRKRV
jgi:hypothetical protein